MSLGDSIIAGTAIIHERILATRTSTTFPGWKQSSFSTRSPSPASPDSYGGGEERA